MKTYLGHDVEKIDTVSGLTVYRDDAGNVVVSQQMPDGGSTTATVTDVGRLVAALCEARDGAGE